MARSKKSKKNNSSAPSYASHLGTVIGVYIAYSIFLVVIAGLLVFALWLIALPNWALFFKYLHADLMLEYTKTLIWPLIVLLLVIVFRAELRAILKRIKAFKWGDKSVELDQQPQSTSPNPVTTGLDNTPSDDETPEQFRERVYNMPEVQLEFERIYRKIYGTQLSILNFLAAVKSPVSTASLDFYYQKHIELLNGSQNFFSGVHAYMSFLVASGVVNHLEEENTYELDLLAGGLFLRYLAEQGISSPDSRPL